MALITQIPLIKKMELVNRLPFFKTLTLAERQMVVESFSELHLFKKDKMVFRQNEHDNHLYIVLSGELVLFKQQHKPSLVSIQPGDFVGEGSFVETHTRSINAKANTETIVLAISHTAMQKLPYAIRDKIKDRIILGMSQRIEKLGVVIEKLQGS